MIRFLKYLNYRHRGETLLTSYTFKNFYTMFLQFFAKGTKHHFLQKLFSGIFFICFFTSCQTAYKSALVEYQKNFADTVTVPDYSTLGSWAAHPDKKDLSDSIPAPLIAEERNTQADVFFIHPTTFLKNKKHAAQWNARISDPELNAKTDYSTILYQASVFNGSGRVYAPRYRQAHIASFFSNDTSSAHLALRTAYTDIKNAFQYYLDNENKGRPVIIAAHSQGTLHAARLLKEFFENKSLSAQLVVAYLWGMPLPPGYFNTLVLCNDSAQTGCYAGWRLFKKGYIPQWIHKETFTSLAVNPISWKSDSVYMSRKKHKGAVLFQFNKIYKKTQGAGIHKGVVWIDRPRFAFSFLYTRRNYHAGDINLFYLDIRENIRERIKSYFFKRSESEIFENKKAAE